tara:strand:+ start:7789 stop:8469 length:681 start_codon:yes stop_codon:yes gene_type:complete
MALPASGNPISMGQMRTEFGIVGAISMNQLYRGGGEVPSTQTTTSTQNQGGTITKAALGGGGTLGQNGSYNTTTVEALPTTLASGDTVATNSNILSTISVANTGGFAGGATNIFFSNSSGTRVGNYLASHAYSVNTNATVTSNKSFSGTIASNQIGATHLAYQVNGGGAQFQQENTTISSSLAQGSITSVQNRQVSSTSNINATVPTGGGGDTEFEFSDMYGAFDV